VLRTYNLCCRLFGEFVSINSSCELTNLRIFFLCFSSRGRHILFMWEISRLFFIQFERINFNFKWRQLKVVISTFPILSLLFRGWQQTALKYRRKVVGCCAFCQIQFHFNGAHWVKKLSSQCQETFPQVILHNCMLISTCEELRGEKYVKSKQAIYLFLRIFSSPR
jgi:hypothetical protein